MKTYELQVTMTLASDREEYEVAEEVLYHLRRFGHYTDFSASIDCITDITEEE